MNMAKSFPNTCIFKKLNAFQVKESQRLPHPDTKSNCQKPEAKTDS